MAHGISLAAATALALVASHAAFGQSRSDAPPRGFQDLGERAIPSGRIEFTSPNEQFPPRPKDYTESRPVQIERADTTRSAERLQAAEGVAAANERVRGALGQRFVNLESGPADGEKAGTGRDAVIVRFYGYETRNTVAVVLDGDNRVVDVRVQKGLQPPEAPAEIRAANEIVMVQSRNKDRLKDLAVTGILTAPVAVRQPKDHRILYLTYNTPRNELVHVAWVDLTTQKIVKEGPPPTQRRR